MPEITTSSQLFYLTLSVIVLFLAFISEKSQNRIFLIILIMTLSLVSGLRSFDVGRDTRNYIEIFNYVKQGGYFDKDPGFGFLTNFILSIYDSYTFVFLIFAFITFFFTYIRLWELRHRISFMWSSFCLYSFYFFESMNAVRQFCAVSIVFFGSRYIEKRQYLKFMVFVLLATFFFHKSAALGFLFLASEVLCWKYLDKALKRKLIILFVLGFFSIFIYMSQLYLYFQQYEHYFLNAESNIGFRVLALILLFTISLFVYEQDGINENNEIQYFLYSTRVYYLISCLLGSLGYFYLFMGRLGYYFSFFQFVYFGLLVKSKGKWRRFFLKTLVMVVTFYILYNYIFYINGAWQHPYNCVLNE